VIIKIMAAQSLASFKFPSILTPPFLSPPSSGLSSREFKRLIVVAVAVAVLDGGRGAGAARASSPFAPADARERHVASNGAAAAAR